MRRTERLKALKVARESTPGMYADGKGLYLQVQAGGNGISKSWLYRYFDPARGRERYMGLGSYPATSLVDAREKAAEQGRLRERGIDPIAHRDTQRAAQRVADAKAMTFDQCRDAYIAAHRSGWRSAKHAGEWLKTLKRYVTPVFGNLPVQSIDVALVTKVLEPIWSTKPETAGRIRGRIETVLDWAGARKLRQGENPARWRGHLDKLLPSRKKLRKIKPVKHLAALPYDELGAFMSELHQRPGVSARALEFTILTVARTAEVLGAQWSEVDLQAKVWTIPAERMKGNREHRVPLSDAAVAVLTRMEKVRQNAFVFPGGRRDALAHTALWLCLGRMGRSDITVHGFRSTFRDWAAERTNFQREVAEAALAHMVGDETERAYRRGDLFDKRRKLMDAWAAYCEKLILAVGQVVTLPFSRALRDSG